jgi:hypothetical protein
VAFEERLTVPIIVAEATELLLEVDHPRARAILEEAEPALRRDLAQRVLATHAWTDTFALACAVRCPRATERLRPLLVALATTYAEQAHRAGGCVQGMRFLDKYDLTPWLFTRAVVIDDDATPHSHPVLTLHTRHLRDDLLLLSTFIHEQSHW